MIRSPLSACRSFLKTANIKLMKTSRHTQPTDHDTAVRYAKLELTVTREEPLEEIHQEAYAEPGPQCTNLALGGGAAALGEKGVDHQAGGGARGIWQLKLEDEEMPERDEDEDAYVAGLRAGQRCKSGEPDGPKPPAKTGGASKAQQHAQHSAFMGVERQ